MTIEEKIQELLAASLPAYGSPVEELVPEARIKPPGDWQNLARPYVVHFPAGVMPIYTHDGREPLTGWTYQVSTFAATYSAARVVADAVRDTLSGVHDGVHCFWQSRVHYYEPDTRTHHIADDFEVHEGL